MKIAICLSGLMYDLKNSMEMINNFYIKPLNADLFVYTCVKNTKEKEEYSKIFEKYIIPKKIIFKDFQEHLKEIHSGIELNIQLNEYSKIQGYRVFSQINMIFNSNELKKKYEKENNFIYDIVIRLRTELFLFRELNKIELELASKNYLCIPSEPEWGGLQHTFFYSSSKIMDQVCSNWVIKDTFKKYNLDFIFKNPKYLLNTDPGRLNSSSLKYLEKGCNHINAEYLFLVHIINLENIKIYRCPALHMGGKLKNINFKDTNLLNKLATDFCNIISDFDEYNDCIIENIKDHALNSPSKPKNFNRFTPVYKTAINNMLKFPFREKTVRGYVSKGYKIDKRISWEKNVLNFLEKIHEIKITSVSYEETEVNIFVPFKDNILLKIKKIKITK